MSRSGLTKSEVKAARDKVVARGLYPSTDRVRIELGNTGSKTTIHKYLIDLKEESSAPLVGPRLSEELTELVSSLVSRIEQEAQQNAENLRASVFASEQELRHQLQQLQQSFDNLLLKQQATEIEKNTLQQDSEQRSTALGESKARIQGLQSEVDGLNRRLVDGEQHRLSLEQKHQHARTSLDHFMTAAKEQRDQELRRHEQQLQILQGENRQLRQEGIVRQDEITRLNQEGAKLVADLAHATRSLFDMQSAHRHLQQQIEQYKTVEEKRRQLHLEVERLTEEIGVHRTDVAALNHELNEARSALALKQVEVASLTSKIETHKAITDELHSYLALRNASSSAGQ